MLDLVMWCKNGGYYLNTVLTQIDKVIPSDVVHKKLLVNDHSTDDTKEIAERCGWTVIDNDGNGIGDAANTALSHVDCKYFISFEHDLVLADNWFARIPLYLLNDTKVAAAQGIRLPDHLLLRKLQEFKIERIKKDGRLTHSIDNTVYRTDIIKQLGGFPRLKGMGVDSILVQKVLNEGYKWITDFDVVSTHLRKGVWQELNHYYRYGLVSPIVSLYNPSITLKRMQLTFLNSPLRGLEIGLKKRDMRLMVLYPMIRCASLLGCISHER